MLADHRISQQAIPPPPAAPAVILVVDDIEDNRVVLSRRLERLGYQTIMAANGRQALARLESQPVDLILLDIVMPEMDGYQVLAYLKADPVWRHLPVIMVSALTAIESIVRCIEQGADDYLTKPFNPTLLRARVSASLEKKRLRDQEQRYLQQIEVAQARAEHLLHNILPAPIAARLQAGEATIADNFSEATVLFADLVDFTPTAARLAAAEVVAMLNELFSAFDDLTLARGLEKIKTIGDAYMVVGGVPTPRADHVEAVADLALAMQALMPRFCLPNGAGFALRIGIHTGPVVAGVIGHHKFSYDLWGDTVNLASRMESQGVDGDIQVSAETYERLRNRFAFEARGPISIKGRNTVPTYLLRGRVEVPVAAELLETAYR